MQKGSGKMPVSSSNKSRVSPYPLRSSRNKKPNEAESSSENVNEWEDVKCVICMDPPHNAVLLQCSSFSKGCRTYMCDTSARHSNCFKQYRKSTTRCSGSKTLHCPYCRGEVSGTTKSTAARRFMNARPRSCSMENCDFSGTYSQLKTHLKSDHPGLTLPKLESMEFEQRQMWEQLEREAEYIELLNAHQQWESERRLLASSLHRPVPYSHPVIDLNVDALIRNLFHAAAPAEGIGRSQVSVPNYQAFMPRLEFHGTLYQRWNP